MSSTNSEALSQDVVKDVPLSTPDEQTKLNTYFRNPTEDYLLHVPGGGDNVAVELDLKNPAPFSEWELSIFNEARLEDWWNIMVRSCHVEFYSYFGSTAFLYPHCFVLYRLRTILVVILPRLNRLRTFSVKATLMPMNISKKPDPMVSTRSSRP